MIEEAIFQKLSGDANIAAVVSTRIYPLRMPQEATLPAIVFTITGSAQQESHSGSSHLAASQVEISSWATTALAARDLGEKVRQALQGFHGTVSGVRIDSVIEWNSSEVYEDDPEMYEHISQATVWHDMP